MVPAQFVIEETFHGGDGRAYVLARAVDASGHQRTDLYGFCLKHVSDFPRLKIGDRVVLE
jgi:hypothetical protein